MVLGMVVIPGELRPLMLDTNFLWLLPEKIFMRLRGRKREKERGGGGGGGGGGKRGGSLPQLGGDCCGSYLVGWLVGASVSKPPLGVVG